MIRFDLMKFVPFRLNRLATEVSEELSKVYTDTFGISIAEWRIIATLAAQKRCSAQQIVYCTRTHKSRISRAVTRLVDQGLVERLDECTDRRETQLRLTHSGRTLHRTLIPLIRDKEREMLSCLDEDEQRAFITALDKLEHSLNLVRRAEENPD